MKLNITTLPDLEQVEFDDLIDLTVNNDDEVNRLSGSHLNSDRVQVAFVFYNHEWSAFAVQK